MIHRSPTQVYFEDMFTKNGGRPFQNVSNDTYDRTILTEDEAKMLSANITQEIIPYYYKALLSYSESIPAINSGNFSWATVKLYYSVFYAVKAYLACNKVSIVRAGLNRSILVRVKAKTGEKLRRCKNNTDHKATFEVEEDLYVSQDRLLSQTMIDGGDPLSVYEWLAKRREEANYKDIIFRDPKPSETWERIQEYVRKQGIGATINDIIDDEWRLCFQDEYAVLGIPTKRLLLTADAIRCENLCIEEDYKSIFVKKILEAFPDGKWNDFILDKLAVY